MNSDLQDRLRADMTRFTRDVRVPPGLALKADRHNRRRRASIRAAAAAAVVVGAAAAGVSGAFGSAPASPIQTTAYVVKQVDGALAPANIDNLIGVTRTVYESAGSLGPLVRVSPSASLGPTCNGSTLQRWQYRGTMKASVYGSRGQHIFDLRTSVASRSRAETEVIYCNRTWWTDTAPGARGTVSPAVGWPARIRSWLSSGLYQVAGYQVVDGMNTIKLTAASRRSTLWVSPQTYLPVRLDNPQTQIDYQWLTPTAAHLALLNEPVPPGFRQVPPVRP